MGRMVGGKVGLMERCPNCEKPGMYPWRGQGSSETARGCLLCGHVEELKPANASPTSQKATPEVTSK